MNNRDVAASRQALAQNLKPAPTPLPVMTGSTVVEDGRGVDIVSGTLTAGRCATGPDCCAALAPRPLESPPVREGGG
ncbi:hypothetical protein, partial [Microvirga brassicacearum]